MRKIKVAQVITRMNWGGSPDLVRIFCQSLQREGFEVTLITGPSPSPSSKTANFLDEFKEHTCFIPQLKRNISPFYDVIAFFRLLFLFSRERFDVVHANTSKAGFLARIAAFCAQTPCIIYMPHGHVFYGYFNPFISRILLFLEKIAAKVTDKIICLTKLEKRDFLRLGVTVEDKIDIIPSGLELGDFFLIDKTSKEELRHTHDLDAGVRIVGMVSRLEPVKGARVFIEAARRVREERNDVLFIIVGEGSLSLELKARVEECGFGDRVLFLGWREDALELIACMDILVQPSLNEAIGRVLLEAQMLGVPVIATNVGGIPEVIQNNLTGMIVEPKDPVGLARMILKLLESDSMRNSLSEEARKLVREKFSSEEMMRRLINTYNVVLDNTL